MYGFDYWPADHVYNNEEIGVVYYWQWLAHGMRETQCLFVWDGRFN